MLPGDRQPIRLLVSLLAVVVLLGVVSSPAQASSVATGGSTLYVTGDDRERNDLLVTYVSSGTYLVAERGAALTLRRLTSQCVDHGGGVARCTAVSTIVVDAGDGADVVAFSGVTIATTITDGPGDDVVSGSGGADLFVGSPGNDVLAGGAGNDRFGDAGGDGADTIDGGTGTDTADYSGRPAALTVALDGAANDGVAGERDDVKPTVDEVFGGSGPDRLTGADGYQWLRGSGGDDVLDGRLGGDRLQGDGGQDTVDYRSRTARVVVSADNVAGDGAGGENDNVLSDVDSILSGSGNDELTGNASSGRIDGGAGDDVLRGGDGHDELFAGEGTDDVDGGTGDDRLDGGPGPDALSGGTGADVVDYSSRTAPVLVDLETGAGGPAGEGDTIDGVQGASGGSGDDVLRGEENEGRWDGGPGDDSIDGRGGADRMAGGDGWDRVEYDSRRRNVTVWIDDGGGDGENGENDNVRRDVEQVTTGSGHDRFGGDDSSEVFSGGAGDDQAWGNGGDDRLDGGAHDDTLEGGRGADELTGGDGADKLNGNDDGDGLAGGEGNDRLYAHNGNDRLDGGNGNDELGGGNGDDSVAGGTGSDSVSGDDGKDHLFGAEGDDKLSGGDDSDGLDAGPGADRLNGGSGPDVLAGGPDGDTLYADGGDDRLDGGDGNDDMNGGSEDDLLVAGPGADRIKGDSGEDTVDYSSRREALKITNDDKADDGTAGEGDNVAGSVDHFIGGLGNDLIRTQSAWNHRLWGGPGNDTLDGGPKVDQLVGGSGDDQLIGREGKDLFEGGAGADKISGADGQAESLRCGSGRDTAVHDGSDKTVACEVLRRGSANAKATKAQAVKVSNLTALARRSNRRLGSAPSVRSGKKALPRCRGKKQLVGTWKTAARAFRLNWKILAALTQTASGYGCDMGPTPAGKLGWTHLTAATWKLWGMDADGDGTASPYSSADAIFSTARYLRASGAPRRYTKALRKYDRAAAGRILKRAKSLR